MSRYFVRSRKPNPPRSEWVDDMWSLTPDLRVDDHEAVDTGLVAADGCPIMRAPNPMGFGRDEEWA